MGFFPCIGAENTVGDLQEGPGGFYRGERVWALNDSDGAGALIAVTPLLIGLDS